MKQLSDELIIEFSQGDPQAFQSVFDSFRSRIFYFVKKMINDAGTAEEITSDTFVKLFHLKEKFSSPNKVQAFLFITARNASLDFIKYKNRERVRIDNLRYEDLEDYFYVFEETNIEADVLQFIHQEIEKLPVRSRTIFKLFYLEGLSTAEIARIMKISPQTVSNQKTTALKLLRMKVLDRRLLILFLFGSMGEN